MTIRYLFLLALLCWLSLHTQAQGTHTHADGTTHAAHGDEADAPHEAKAGGDHFTVYALSEKYELTLYYPELTAGQEAHLTLFVADVETNHPIDKAVLTVSAAEATGRFEVHPESPGVYELHATFAENKVHTLNVQIAHPNGADLIGIQGVEVGKKLTAAAVVSEKQEQNPGWLMFLGGLLAGLLLMYFILKKRNRTLTLLFLVVSAWWCSPGQNFLFAHGDEEHGPKSGSGGFGKKVEAPKETQFLFEVLTQSISKDDYQGAATMFGTVVPASGGLGAVVAPLSGRMASVRVQVGQSVRAGQVVAVLQQSVATADQVGVAASNATLALQVETAKVRLAAAQREYDRLKKIEDIAAGKDIAAAEANLNAARTELATLNARAVGANATANGRMVTLTAPVSGVIGAFTLTPGTEVTAGQTLMTITNIKKVYIEAQVYDRDLSAIRSDNRFTVTCSTDDHKTAEVRLIAQAQAMNTGNQSQRVLFEMQNPNGDFKIGEFVTLTALNNHKSRQIAVPNAALTEINGKTAVFTKRGPEIFEMTYVQTGEDDGTHTLILKGIEEGRKIVVQGAYEVKMMYLNQ